jgi:hypothetical protein
LFTIASRKLREPRFWVYQLGRGSEPVIVVGSMIFLVARSMIGISPWRFLSLPLVYVDDARHGNDLRNVLHEAWTKRATLPTLVGQFSCCGKNVCYD